MIVTLRGALPEFASQLRDWTSLLTADLQGAALTDHGGVNTVQSGNSLWLPGTSAWVSASWPSSGPHDARVG